MKKISKLGTIILLAVAPVGALGITTGVVASALKHIGEVEIDVQPSEGGTVDTSSIYIPKGCVWEDAQKPKAIANEGYIFEDWYCDDQPINRLTVIDSPLNITAKFVPISAQVINTSIYKCAGDGTYTAITGSLPLITMFNDLSMGYMKIVDFYAAPNYEVTESNQKTIIKNTIRSTRQATCTIDYKNQTITFSNIDDFYDYDTESVGPMMYHCLFTGHKYFKNEKLDYYKDNGALTIDLSKYNIRCIWYNNQGYLPFEFLRNVLNFPQQFAGFASIGLADFNGYGLYQVPNRGDAYELAYKQVVKQTSGNYYNSKYMEYIYSLLALSLDLNYGMVQRQSRANVGTTIKYLEEGALKSLRPYHDGIVSLEDNKSPDTIRQAMREHFDDGGHSAYLVASALSTRAIGDYEGSELKYTSNVSAKLRQARKNTVYDVPSGKAGYYQKFDDAKGNIGYLTFDSFMLADDMTTEEVTAGRKLPGYTTDANYGNDVIRLTMYVNQKVRDDNIKNLVLDMSLNSGGTAYAEHFIASWLCGGVTQKIYNPKTKSYCQYTVQADINNDGVFDDKDVLSDTVNVFVITSSAAFSCGNILPCNIKDQRTNAKFIGHNTGGGPCIVDQNMSLGTNSVYQISSNTHLIRLASDENNFISMDDGCGQPIWQMDEINKSEDFYKRDKINEWIWNQ